jgi:hypothetical protein
MSDLTLAVQFISNKNAYSIIDDITNDLPLLREFYRDSVINKKSLDVLANDSKYSNKFSRHVSWILFDMSFDNAANDLFNALADIKTGKTDFVSKKYESNFFAVGNDRLVDDFQSKNRAGDFKNWQTISKKDIEIVLDKVKDFSETKQILEYNHINTSQCDLDFMYWELFRIWCFNIYYKNHIGMANDMFKRFVNDYYKQLAKPTNLVLRFN